MLKKNILELDIKYISSSVSVSTRVLFSQAQLDKKINNDVTIQTFHINNELGITHH